MRRIGIEVYRFFTEESIGTGDVEEASVNPSAPRPREAFTRPFI